MTEHIHKFARVPKLAGSWIACVECDEPYRGPKFIELINAHVALEQRVERLGKFEHGYTTNNPGPHEITLHFDSHEEMQEWLEALAEEK